MDDSEVRLCGCCVEWRPVGEFRLRRRGSEHRHHQCNDCAAAYQRWRRARKRGEAMDRAVVRLRRYRDCPGKLAVMVEGLFHVFGGGDGFFATFGEQFEQAREAGRHDVVFRYFAFVLGMLRTASPMEDADETALLSNDELDAECETELMRALIDYGYSADDAAELAEWIVERV